MSAKSRLIVIAPNLPPAHGIAVVVDTLLRSRLQDVFDIIPLDLTNHSRTAQSEKVSASSMTFLLTRWLVFLWLLLTRRPRVVYVVLSESSGDVLRGSLFLWSAWLFRVRLVVHFQSGGFRTWYDLRWVPMQAYIRATVRLASKAIVLSDSLRSMLAGLADDESIVVVSNGVECVDEWEDRKFPSGHRPWKLLFLSALSRRRGALVLLASIPTILRTRRDVEFVLAGPWLHEADRNAALRYIAQHQLESFVKLTGSVEGESKVRLLQSVDAFLFPSIQPEGQPVEVLEAMAAGLPVIYTDPGCLRETVLPGEGGVEAYANDPYDLALQILWLLDHPEERHRYGYEAQRRCRLFFNQDRFIERMIRALQEVAAEPPIRHPSPILRGEQQ